jgi:hypothetical protein
MHAGCGSGSGLTSVVAQTLGLAPIVVGRREGCAEQHDESRRHASNNKGKSRKSEEEKKRWGRIVTSLLMITENALGATLHNRLDSVDTRKRHVA